MLQVQKFDNRRKHSEVSVEQRHANLSLNVLLDNQWLLRSKDGVEGDGITQEHKEAFGVLDAVTLLTVVVVFWVYVSITCITLYNLNMCSLVYMHCTSIKLFKMISWVGGRRTEL